MRNQRIRDNGCYWNRQSLPDAWAIDQLMDQSCYDEFESNPDWGNGAALIRINAPIPIWRAYLDGFGFLNQAERREINQHAGCIVEWDSQGFHYVTWFKDEKELDSAWDTVSASFDTEDEFVEA
jgi:hypothetical protein